MTNFMFAKNKIEFVDGRIKKPEKTSKDYMPWMRVDAMIKGWLTTAMEKNIRNSVKYADAASEIWSDLNERFGKESAPRAYELKQKIASTRQGGASVSTYFTQLRSIWDEAQSIYPFPRCSCNKCECDVGKKINEHQEKERLYEFLMGLDAEFTVIRTQILATKPVPSLGTAYHMVAEDDRQRAVSNENINPHESTAFKAFQRRNCPPGIQNGGPERKEKRQKGRPRNSEESHPLRGSVVIPNGDSIPVKGKGDYVLLGGTKVNGVLYVPEFKCNLLSVSRLCRDLQCSISFFLDLCIMQGLQKRNLIGAGKCQGGKLGHASKGKLAKMDFLKTSINDLGNFCDSCAKAKHTRLPFPSSFIKTSAPFELIHCDIWGGYRVSSYTKVNYFLTIVDDFSRAVQFEKQTKRVRCDNGGEFTSNDMLEFYNENGIMLETTCPDTPQQNGVVKRKHRHLLEIARALRTGANLPKRLWGECILTAAYVINRLPSKFILKTPTLKETSSKKEGSRGVFIGYPPRTKGYKILDLETRKIIVNRDVNFHEENFPFKNVQGNNESETEEPIICHDCHCHDEPILAQNKEQNPMEQDPQMDHDQTNEPSGPHETHDGDEMDQINDEGQPNNDEFETNESNEGAEAQAETRPTRTRTQPSRFKYFVVQVPPSVKHPTSASNQVTSTKDLPKGKRAIDSKWVYKIKFKPNGEVERYKARLVAKGFTQMEGVDYHDTFAPVAKLATPDQGILISRSGDPALTAYCDSDWLGCPYTRRSRTGYMLLLGGIIWVRWLLSELHVHNPLATPLFCDNQAAQHIANNHVFHERTKHIEMDCYFVCERVESKEIILMKISSVMQIADLLTKGLSAHQLQFLLGKIGIVDLHAPS
ncbi:putative RNA-directed DNA polymerase [Tanacetum coccineum]